MTWRFETRTAPRDPHWWLGLAMVVAGAALTAYILDPERGKARRRRITDQAGHKLRAAVRKVRRTARHASHTLVGRGRHLLLDGQADFADGRALLDRVESELFEDPAVPRGRMNIEVEGLTVILRGELDSLDQMEKVEAAVSRIPGVLGVRSYLHLPGTPAPNKLAALSALAPAGER